MKSSGLGSSRFLMKKSVLKVGFKSIFKVKNHHNPYDFFFIQNISEGELFLKDMNSYYAVHRKGNKEFVSKELFSIRFENMYRIKMAIKEIVCIS